MPFKRKDIAKAFFNLDLFNNKPLTPKPRDRNRLIASKPFTINKAKKKKSPF